LEFGGNISAYPDDFFCFSVDDIKEKQRNLDPQQLNNSGQHEFLNWICLAGAMEERKPRLLLLSESYLFNSNRMVVVFPV